MHEENTKTKNKDKKFDDIMKSKDEEKLENRIEELSNLIRNLNPETESVEILKEYLDELNEKIKEYRQSPGELDGHPAYTDEQYWVDMTSLPWSQKYKAELKDDKITGYPTWACDNAGYCIVGNAADEIQHIDEIKENLYDD